MNIFKHFCQQEDMVYVNSTDKHKAHNMSLSVSSYVTSIFKKWFMNVKYNCKFNNM